MSELDESIHAEGERLRAAAHKGALEARKANLLAKLAQVESQLAQFAPEEKPEPVKKPAPRVKRQAKTSPKS